MSVLFVVSYATVPRWFDRRQGLAGGLASAGLGAGMLVVAPAAENEFGGDAVVPRCRHSVGTKQ